MSGARESHFSGSERRLLELIRSAAAENKSHGEVMRNTASVAPIKRRTSRESVARNPSATRTGRTPNRNAGTRRAVVTAAMSTRLASLGRCEHERDSFWCVPRAHQPALQRTSAARADGNHRWIPRWRVQRRTRNAATNHAGRGGGQLAVARARSRRSRTVSITTTTRRGTRNQKTALARTATIVCVPT